MTDEPTFGEDYLLIIPKLDWICMIPKDDFRRYFQVVEEDTVKIRKEKFDGWMGGWDTYLQSYCVDHARSSIRGGEMSIRLCGIYYLSFD